MGSDDVTVPTDPVHGTEFDVALSALNEELPKQQVVAAAIAAAAAADWRKFIS